MLTICAIYLESAIYIKECSDTKYSLGGDVHLLQLAVSLCCL